MAKEVVVSTLAQVYHLPVQTHPQDQPSFLADLSSIPVSFWEATLQTGKQSLETLTPGVDLFPQEAAGEDPALARALQANFTPLQALAFLVFVLLYVPCIATVGALRHEFGWRWAGLSLGLNLAAPWLAATLVYQGGKLLGFG
jgi:ferrous iron transport protein B